MQIRRMHVSVFSCQRKPQHLWSAPRVERIATSTCVYGSHRPVVDVTIITYFPNGIKKHLLHTVIETEEKRLETGVVRRHTQL